MHLDPRRPKTSVRPRLPQPAFMEPTAMIIAERLASGEPIHDRTTMIETFLYLERRSATFDRETAELIIDWYTRQRPSRWRPGRSNASAHLPLFVLHPVLWRAAGKCEECGATGAPLELHHRHFMTFNVERPSDIQLLCAACAERAHVYVGRYFPDPSLRPDRIVERLQWEAQYGYLGAPPEGEEARAAWEAAEAAERRVTEAERRIARL